MPPLSQAVRYGLPGFALAFAALPLYLLTPALYADKIGVSLAAVGIVLMLTRLTDAFSDPIIGRLMDRSTTGLWVWMAVAVAVMAASLSLLVNPPVTWLQSLTEGSTGLMAWMGITALVVSLANSTATLAHQSWAVAWAVDPKPQSRLVASRESWALLGVIVASVIAAQRSGAAMAIVLLAGSGIAIAASMGIRSHGAAKRVAKSAIDAARWSDMFAVHEFRKLLVAFSINALANAIPATLVLFFLQDALGASRNESSLLLAGYFASAAVSVAFWTWVANKIGIMGAWKSAMLIAAAAFVWTLTLGHGDIVAFTVICVATGFALGAELVCPPVLLGMVISAGGHRGQLESSYFGIWNLVIKLALAAAAGLALPVLGLLQYVPGGASQASNISALQWAYAGVPCLLKCIAVVALSRVTIQHPSFRSSP